MTDEASPPKRQADTKLLELVDGVIRIFGEVRIRIRIPGASAVLVVPAHPEFRMPPASRTKP